MLRQHGRSQSLSGLPEDCFDSDALHTQMRFHSHMQWFLSNTRELKR